MARPKGSHATEAPRGLLHFGPVPDGMALSKNAWKYVHCAGWDDVCTAVGCNYIRRFRSPAKALPRDDYFTCRLCGGTKYERKFHHFANIDCDCSPGPQHLAYVSPAFEVAIGGGRGGLKTETGFALSIRGNIEEYSAAIKAGKQPRPVDITYIASPHYRFLVLRKNAKDMKDCWSRAKQFYARLPIASSFNDSDMVVRFETGAEGVFDHLATEDAYEKYQGQEFQFIWPEELTQIPDEERYQKVTLSCRSSFPELRQHLFATANPGGPGNTWFKARFVDIAPERTIYTDPVTGLTRTFIHSTVFDNPYFLRDNAQYLKQLQAIPQAGLRKKWFLGDFSALDGQFFTEFRDARMAGEPETALHVLPHGSVELLPHWRRWVSLDWGFSHNFAALKHCRAADQRTYTYGEMVESRVGLRELGVRIANWCLPDLQGLPDHHMNLYLSPDAFGKRDEHGSAADQIAGGISEVLGKGAAFVVDFTDHEKSLPAAEALAAMQRRQELQQTKTNLTIQRANNNRIHGWGTMRELMRWWPMLPAQAEPDRKVAEDLLMQKGVTAYLDYVQKIEAWRSEVLPKWRTFAPVVDPVTGKPVPNTGCPQLIKCLQFLQHEEGTEDVMKVDGDDAGDSCRYGLHAIHEEQNVVPRELVVANAVAALGDGASGHSRYMTAVHVEKKCAQTIGMKIGTLPRNVGRHRRSMVSMRTP